MSNSTVPGIDVAVTVIGTPCACSAVAPGTAGLIDGIVFRFNRLYLRLQAINIRYAITRKANARRIQRNEIKA